MNQHQRRICHPAAVVALTYGFSIMAGIASAQRSFLEDLATEDKPLEGTLTQAQLAELGLVYPNLESFDPNKKTVVIVHGDEPEGPGDFRGIHEEFEAAGYNVFFYGYQDDFLDDSDPDLGTPTGLDVEVGFNRERLEDFTDGIDDLEDAADGLHTALQTLANYPGVDTLGVYGFSQGGVVSRKSVTTRIEGADIKFMSGAAPFGGVEGFSSVGSRFAQLSTFYGPMARRDSTIFNGTPQSNVTWVQLKTEGDGVVPPGGQSNRYMGRPDDVITIEATHMGLIREDAGQKLAVETMNELMTPRTENEPTSMTAPESTGGESAPGGTGDARSKAALDLGGATPLQNAMGLVEGAGDGLFSASDVARATNLLSGINTAYYNLPAAESAQRNVGIQLMIILVVSFDLAPRFGLLDAPPLARVASLEPGSLIGSVAQGASAAPPVRTVITSLGVSSGRAFTVQAANSGDTPVNGAAMGLVVEALERESGRTVQEDFEKDASGNDVRQLPADGYCLEYLREPPEEGTVFRVAPGEVQKRFEPARRILAATQQLQELGLLTPDSDPLQYLHSIRQWAIWSQEQGFMDELSFGKAFLERTQKNFAAADRPWTDEIANIVRGLVPNRWKDVSAVLQKAEEFVLR